MKMSIIAYLPPIAGIIGALIGGFFYKKNQSNKQKNKGS